jgi:Fur family peroxide stress response transcriptional regulator
MLRSVRGVGLKLTPQRMAIVGELAADETHPTAQELYERLLPSLPTMSLATVYNTLDALSSAGLCSAMAVSRGSARFDPNMAPHHHAICDGCGLVRDLERPDGEPGVQDVRSAQKALPGFRLRAVEHVLRGLCFDCAKRAKFHA